MPEPTIRVLYIEDSGLMRLIVSDMLRNDPGIELVDTAQNGLEGLEKTKRYRPDVVVTDLLMPDYDGLYAVRHIMREVPTPIIVLSTLDKTNAQVFDALDAGAFDFIDKPKSKVISGIRQVDSTLLRAVRLAAQADPSSLVREMRPRNVTTHTFDTTLCYDIICVGTSTGGPGAVEMVLGKLPGNLSIPVVIAQHMPERFLETFAKRLDAITPMRVALAEKGETLAGGTVYIAPGHVNTQVVRKLSLRQPVFAFTEEKYREFNHPSVDCLMLSVAETYRHRAIGVLLSGMGKDGTQGLAAIHGYGGYTVVQDEASSVVFGMGKSALEKGVVKQVVTLPDIAGFLVSCL